MKTNQLKDFSFHDGEMVELVDTAVKGIMVNLDCFHINVGSSPTLGHK
jgi:hypothetical protein